MRESTSTSALQSAITYNTNWVFTFPQLALYSHPHAGHVHLQPKKEVPGTFILQHSIVVSAEIPVILERADCCGVSVVDQQSTRYGMVSKRCTSSRMNRYPQPEMAFDVKPIQKRDVCACASLPIDGQQSDQYREQQSSTVDAHGISKQQQVYT